MAILGAARNRAGKTLRVFVDDALSVASLTVLLPFKPEQTFDLAKASRLITDFAALALEEQNMKLVGDVMVVRHRPGQRGLPGGIHETDYRFAIDLTESETSIHGGLLLFIDEEGRAFGWRSQSGAMTIWSGSDPELTELVPGSCDRITLVGSARLIGH